MNLFWFSAAICAWHFGLACLHGKAGDQAGTLANLTNANIWAAAAVVISALK